MFNLVQTYYSDILDLILQATYSVFPKIQASFNLHNYLTTQQTTAFGVCEFCSVGRMRCHWWQCHDASVVKMVHTIVQHVFLVKLSQDWIVFLQIPCILCTIYELSVLITSRYECPLSSLMT
jgi:hypothetical protein